MPMNSGWRGKRTKCDGCGRLMATSIQECRGSCGQNLCTRWLSNNSDRSREQSCLGRHRFHAPQHEKAIKGFVYDCDISEVPTVERGEVVRP